VFLGIDVTRHRAQQLLSGLLALFACIAMGSPSASASGHVAKRYYVSKQPQLKVDLTIYRHRLWRVSVSSKGVCEDGTPADQLGFAIVGGSGLAIKGRAQRFNDSSLGSTRTSIFRGRVNGDTILGVYRGMYREVPTEEGGKEEPWGQRCGSGSSPRGAVLNFVAHRVGSKGFPPWMR
jgi:hypothetical protein